MPRTSVGLKRFCQARAGELISNIPGAFFFGGLGRHKRSEDIIIFWGKVVAEAKRSFIYGWGCDPFFLGKYLKI